jgi:predicted Rossmann-fold nucleotide-binding protein
MYDAMQNAASLIAVRKGIVCTGAYGGSGMEAPIKGALQGGGEIRAHGMWDLKQNQFASDFPGSCMDWSHSRVVFPGSLNPLAVSQEEAFGLRFSNLMMADAFIMGADGGVGTLLEFCGIVNLQSKLWGKKEEPIRKPFAILNPPATANPAFSLEYEQFRSILFKLYVPEEVQRLIKVCAQPDEAANWIFTHIGM